MSEPLYVPVLSVRQYQRKAYEDLRPRIQAAVAPLWNLPACPGVAPAELKKLWRRELSWVSGAHGSHPAWVDAPFAEDEQAVLLPELLFEFGGLFSELRPVTGPERCAAQQAAALDTARRNGCGIGVRVSVPGEWGAGTTARTTGDVHRLLTQVPPDARADLLLDLGSVLPDRPNAGKEAVRALDALLPLAKWRTTVVIGGGFPQVTGDMLELGELREEPRTDWHTWHEIQTTGRAYVPQLTYGDYGVLPATALARKPGGGPVPWGVLRYTIDRWFVLCKVRNEGPERAADIRAAARRICDLPEFRGARASAGDTWLYDCAEGPDSSGDGTGQVGPWQWAGNIQHMTYVAQCLRRP
ncbi:beta family protein [Streptomyces odontomachi]|uniref:beta family protein n=1 Tax=Streptomyces odontomachi TaxID=2944940 RepID=UPI00210B7A69|nr:beta family protein [Streptomyces sp. ODS25]